MNIRKPNRNNAPLENNGRLFQSSLDILWDIEASDAIETIQKKSFTHAKSKTRRYKILYWSTEKRNKCYNDWYRQNISTSNTKTQKRLKGEHTLQAEIKAPLLVSVSHAESLST